MADKIAALVFVAAAVGLIMSVGILAVAAIGMLLTRPRVPPRGR